MGKWAQRTGRWTTCCLHQVLILDIPPGFTKSVIYSPAGIRTGFSLNISTLPSTLTSIAAAPYCPQAFTVRSSDLSPQLSWWPVLGLNPHGRSLLSAWPHLAASLTLWGPPTQLSPPGSPNGKPSRDLLKEGSGPILSISKPKKMGPDT